MIFFVKLYRVKFTFKLLFPSCKAFEDNFFNSKIEIAIYEENTPPMHEEDER